MVLCNTIIIFLVYTLEPYLWIKSMSVLQRRFDNPRVYLLAGIGYYLITASKQLMTFFDFSDFTNFYEMSNIVMNGLTLVYMFGMTFFLFKSELYKKIISIGMYGFLTFVTELPFIAFSMYFFHLTLSQFTTIGWLNTCATIMAKIMLALGCGLFFTNSKRMFITKLYGNKEIVPLLIINFVFEYPTFSVLRNAKLYQNMDVILHFTLVQVLLIGNGIYIIYILRKTNRKLSITEEELNKSRQINELNIALRQLRHDMSLHTSVMKQMARENGCKELEDYIDNTFADVEVAEDVFTLSDHALSLTLSQLSKKAKEKGIKFQRMITVDDFIIPSHEICSIVANMVSNAIEATEDMSESKRIINLEMASTREGYYINCINPCDKVAKTFQTTKKDKENHGLGIGIIKKLTEKNYGVMKIIPHEDCFEINCFIPDRRKGENRGLEI